MQSMSHGQGLFEGLEYGILGRGGEERSQNRDRRLPMLRRPTGTGHTYSKAPLSAAEHEREEFIGWDDLQFFGENMVGLFSQKAVFSM